MKQKHLRELMASCRPDILCEDHSSQPSYSGCSLEAKLDKETPGPSGEEMRERDVRGLTGKEDLSRECVKERSNSESQRLEEERTSAGDKDVPMEGNWGATKEG